MYRGIAPKVLFITKALTILGFHTASHTVLQKSSTFYSEISIAATVSKSAYVVADGEKHYWIITLTHGLQILGMNFFHVFPSLNKAMVAIRLV